MKLDEQTLSYCSISTKFLAQALMPEVFWAGFGNPHDEICAALDDPDVRKVNIRASRGLGKTSLVSRAYLARMVLFRRARYIVYITKSESLAIQKTENLRRELLRNRLIRENFGDIRVTGYEDDFEESFSKTTWVAGGHTLVFPRGLGQPVRGLLFDHYRPDVIVMDDVQEVKELRNERKRQEDFEWLRSDVEEAIDQYSRQYKIIFIDTVKHEDALSERLSELPDWYTVTVPICGEDRKSRIPDLIPDSVIEERYQSHKLGGTLDQFARETLCKATHGETAPFQREHFKYYDEMEREFRERARELENVVLVDPARTENPAAAESAIVGVGVDFQQGAFYVRDIVSARIPPDQVQDEALGMVRRLNARAIGIERTGLGAWGTWPFENEIRKRGIACHVVPLDAARGLNERGKIERIKALIPFYRRGLVYHNPACTGGLESQLLGFPNSKYWDQMDALAYVVRVMDEGERFFLPSDSQADVPGDDENAWYEHLRTEDRRAKPVRGWRLV